MDFDLHRLEQFLLSRVENIQGPMTLERIKGGQSNPTFFVDFPGRRLVLRKQPAADLLPSAHAIDREFARSQRIRRTPSGLAGADRREQGDLARESA